MAISIHAPRTGSDTIFAIRHSARKLISIHAPRTGSDRAFPSILHSDGNFNPRSPHGERPDGERTRPVFDGFQSTLPARGATGSASAWVQTAQFQSTLPARGATYQALADLPVTIEISIHAPRTGSDEVIATAFALAPNISIHAPRTGSDLYDRHTCENREKFQSTLPARGATSLCAVWQTCSAFQSTLPARGATTFSP